MHGLHLLDGLHLRRYGVLHGSKVLDLLARLDHDRTLHLLLLHLELCLLLLLMLYTIDADEDWWKCLGIEAEALDVKPFGTGLAEI
jgi:hypothetical protein